MDKTREWRKANPEKARAIDQRYRSGRKARGLPDLKTSNRVALRKRNPSAALLQGVKAKAKRLGLPFDIDIGDLIVPEFCPVLGVRIILEPFRHEHGPSVDRVIPSRGYVKGNVVVMSMRAHRMKSDASIDDIRALLAFMEKWAQISASSIGKE